MNCVYNSVVKTNNSRKKPMTTIKSLIFFAAVAISSVLTGCTSMTISECEVADWGRIGFMDGARGQSERQLATYVKDCAETSIEPNPQEYRKGWDNGIQQYCTASNGWDEGIQGHEHKAQACRGQAGNKAFISYFSAGMQLYITNEQISRNEAEINQLVTRIDESTVAEREKRYMRERLSNLEYDQYRLRYLKITQQQVAP